VSAYLATYPPRRTIADRPLRTRADDQRLDQHRQIAKAFQALVDESSNYPDPADNYVRATPFGLTATELRAEWSRRAREGWRPWELDERLRPGPLASDGVAA
jgi:hypothetical protein